MKPNRSFKPQNLRTILIIVLVTILIGGIGLFYLGFSSVQTYAEQVNQKLVEADVSSKEAAGLRALKSKVSQNDSLIQNVNQLFATPESYRDQVTTDVKNYASAAGLSIERITFKEGSGHTVVVTLSSPASYQKLITFLNNIETNVPKLQVSSISLTTVDATNADSVGVGDIEIDVLVR